MSMPDLAAVLPDAPIRIAVVGHTNTGKTSLLRTLTRNSRFGVVADRPGTTRHVEGARLLLDGKPAIAWYDTPGIEDSIALLEYLDDLARDDRLDGPARIRRFLDTPEARGRFEQEARVLSRMLESDAALYVIDARDPVLAKHRDELEILNACGRPLLPVLNFVNAPDHRVAEWRDAMSRLGLHATAEFDTVLPALDGEAQLYARLALLLDREADLLRRLAEDLAQQRRDRRVAAYRIGAEVLVDVAALHVQSGNDAAALAASGERLQTSVRIREQSGIDALLALYNFSREDYAAEHLPLEGTRWGMDLFHPQTLKDMGVQLGAGVAAGAMAGAAVDVLTAGLSLGTGMLIGAAAGGMWQGVERFGKRLAGRVRGYRELSVDDAVLRVLALRQRALIQALERRGHAATAPLQLVAAQDEKWRKAALPDGLKEARSRPEWSALAPGHDDDARRKTVVKQLAQDLARAE